MVGGVGLAPVAVADAGEQVGLRGAEPVAGPFEQLGGPARCRLAAVAAALRCSNQRGRQTSLTPVTSWSGPIRLLWPVARATDSPQRWRIDAADVPVPAERSTPSRHE